MNKFIAKSVTSFSMSLLVMGCASSLVVTSPISNYSNTASRVTELSESESKRWGHLDVVKDTVPGMSIDRAYQEIIRKKKGETVIVAVLDSGIDLNHEDLTDVLWINKGEIPGDGIDNDNNGFIDDVHGYNFLGESYNEQVEYARILRLGIGDEALQKAAKEKLESELPESVQMRQQLEQIMQIVSNADLGMKNDLGQATYTLEDLEGFVPKNQLQEQQVGILMQVFSLDENVTKALEGIQEGVTYYANRVDYNLNVDFDGRKPVGDNPYDIHDKKYGNGNPNIRYKDESHGTHVAGIIAASRNNKKGVDGVAQHVKIMSIRAVPQGDEYDKDIALGIRYAVDNGAKIINASFGKEFSPNADWVYEALKYAASKDVLFVHAAGNDGKDLDDPSNPNYPNDHKLMNTPEFVENVITVGALSSAFGPEMVASFSNYGKENVDIFAPGEAIFSTMPGGEYDFQGGTSMAAPAVAGLAALIRSYYPSLTAPQVKKVIMESGIAPKVKVVLGNEGDLEAYLHEVSKSGKIANAYNALILAGQVAKGEVSL
jgi:cell wall-associated protease